VTSNDSEFLTLLIVASELDSGALLMLGAEPSPTEAAEHARARAAARAGVARRGLSSELERVGAEIVRWSGVGGAGSGVYAPVSAPGDLLLADLRRQALPALLDAAMALALGDALDPASRETLLVRWQLVTGTGA
jgi:hypothetical protein